MSSEPGLLLEKDSFSNVKPPELRCPNRLASTILSFPSSNASHGYQRRPWIKNQSNTVLSPPVRGCESRDRQCNRPLHHGIDLLGKH